MIRQAAWLVAVTALLGTACSDASGPGGFLVDSTETAANIPLVATVPVPASYGIHDTFVRDGLVFACVWNTGLIIYDVGNGIRGGSPTAPVEVGRVVTANNGTPGPEVHNAWWFHNPTNGQKRYVFVGQEGPASIGSTSTGDIHVVDVTDMARPVEVAFYHMSGTPAAGTHNFWMDEAAQVLYAAYYNGGVVALDVSGTLAGDLATRELARFKPATTMFTWGVQVANNSVYLSDMLTGFWQLKFSGTAFTAAAGGSNVPDRYGADLWVNSSFAYSSTWGGQPRSVAGSTPPGNYGNAIKVWSLSATGAPTLVDSVVIQGVQTTSDVKGTTDGKLLVVTAEGGTRAGLYVFSLADPARPSLVGVSRGSSSPSGSSGLHTLKIGEIGGKRYVFAAKNPSSPALLIYDISAF